VGFRKLLITFRFTLSTFKYIYQGITCNSGSFTYIRLDAMLCGFFRLAQLPVASTFWRYVDSMGINQGLSLIKVMSALRERFC